jgi:hypothetical protein
MYSKSIIKLGNNFFSACKPETEFTGFLHGFRPAKDYWIGVCQLDVNPDSNLLDEIVICVIEFILCKRTEKTMAEIFSLKTENGNRKLKLIYKGMPITGFPLFEYKFE